MRIGMRLYRGLQERYRSDRNPAMHVDCTNCPYTATLYAVGSRGHVLVLDIPDDKAHVRVSKELWLDKRAERWMVWGRFDDHIIGIIPAKELRRRISGKGMRAMPDSDKSEILKAAIDQALRRASTFPIVTLGSEPERLAKFQAEVRRERAQKPGCVD